MNDYSTKHLKNMYKANVKSRLRYFCRKNLTPFQAHKLIIAFEDNHWLFNSLCQAYNEYKVCCGKEHLCVITNLDALFKTPEAEEAFIKEIKKYVMDVFGIEREDVKNGTTTDNRAE